MSILLTHELGHFFASRRHGVKTTIPYFIPAPPPVLTGTFGAIIKTFTPVTNRKALLDIAVSGPVAGFIVSIAATVIGLKLSHVIYLQQIQTGVYGFGSSIIFHILLYMVLGPTTDQYYVLLHPIAVAGWIGLFVTSANLLPIGQSDGGHIAYAVLGGKHYLVSIAILILLIVMGILMWPGYILWAILFTIFGIRHPPLADEFVVFDRSRRIIGCLNLVVFVLTFIPSPVRFY
jgi:membrane-associated protease RseP (regulator of RpoE activity)